jgi:proliferating cell nuclear antigen
MSEEQPGFMAQPKTTPTPTAVYKMALSDAKNLVTAFSCVSKVVGEVNICLKQEGLQVISMDAANIAMVDLNINKSAFVTYPSDLPTDGVIFGIKMTDITPLLKRIEKEALTLEFGTHNLKMYSNKKAFEVPFIELENKNNHQPPLTMKVSVIIKSAEFTEAVEDMLLVSDESCEFLCEGEKVSFIADTSTKRAAIDLTLKKPILMTPCKCRYSLKYLENFMAGAKLAEDMTLEFGKEYPVRLRYHSAYVQIDYILAPRVDNS